MTPSFRPTTSEDAADLFALVHASLMTSVGSADFDPSDVDAALKSPCSIVAVAPNEAIMGWGYLDSSAPGTRDFVEVFVHPEGGLPAQEPLLERLLSQVDERGTDARAGAAPTETAWIAMLEDAGFTFVKQNARMRIDLPAQVTAEAVTVRPVAQDELPEFHRVIDVAFQDTPDYQPRPYLLWRERFIDGHAVDWDEWLVAVVDGAIAGALQSRAGEEGEVESLAVRRDYRHRGVGRALLGAAFKIYASKGRTEAGLDVDLDNPTEASKLYTGMGMTPVYRINIYEQARPR